jgi:hypothetical protein
MARKPYRLKKIMIIMIFMQGSMLSLYLNRSVFPPFRGVDPWARVKDQQGLLKTSPGP